MTSTDNTSTREPTHRALDANQRSARADWWAHRLDDWISRTLQSARAHPVVTTGTALLLLALIKSVTDGSPLLLTIGTLAFFTGAAGSFLRFLVAMESDGPPVVERSWGGFGGGAGGVRISKSLTYVLLTIVLGSGGVWAAREASSAAEATHQRREAAEDKAKDRGPTKPQGSNGAARPQPPGPTRPPKASIPEKTR